MKARTLRWSVALLVGASGVACADSSDEVTPSDTTSADAGDTILDATSVDASDVEVSADVDASRPDAAPRTCSDQDFCHTVLPPKQVLRAVWGDGTGDVWAVSDTGSILRWDGAAWEIHTKNTSDQYFAIWGSSPTDLWIGGSSGLLHGTGTESSNIVFTAVDTPGDPTIPISSISGTSATDVWAVGGFLKMTYPFSSSGRVLHMVDGVWTAEDPSLVDLTIAYSHVWSTPGSGVWLSGSSMGNLTGQLASLVRRLPGADAFAPETLPSSTVYGELVTPFRVDSGGSLSDTEVVIFGSMRGDGAAVWRGTSADDGATFAWTVEPRPAPDPVPIADYAMAALWIQSAADAWVAGSYGRVRHYDGTAWTEAALSVSSKPEVAPFYGIWGTSDDDLWVVGDNIAIHKTSSSSP